MTSHKIYEEDTRLHLWDHRSHRNFLFFVVHNLSGSSIESCVFPKVSTTSCGWSIQPLLRFSVEPTCLHPDREVNMEETMHMVLMTSSAWSTQPLCSAVKRWVSRIIRSETREMWSHKLFKNWRWSYLGCYGRSYHLIWSAPRPANVSSSMIISRIHVQGLHDLLSAWQVQPL